MDLHHKVFLLASAAEFAAKETKKKTPPPFPGGGIATSYARVWLMGCTGIT